VLPPEQTSPTFARLYRRRRIAPCLPPPRREHILKAGDHHPTPSSGPSLSFHLRPEALFFAPPLRGAAFLAPPLPPLFFPAAIFVALLRAEEADFDVDFFEADFFEVDLLAPPLLPPLLCALRSTADALLFTADAVPLKAVAPAFAADLPASLAVLVA
jgi:hypothetical protein